MKNEQWKPIDGYESRYAVSSLGRVKSKSRIDGQGREWPERILKPGLASNGCMTVSLHKNDGGKTFTVHELVASSFIGKRPSEADINHINGDRTDNRLENLEYCSRQENMDHAIETGLHDRKGSNHPHAKLNEGDVLEIRERASNGEYQKNLAKEYDVSPMTISCIVRRDTWKHI